MALNTMTLLELKGMAADWLERNYRELVVPPAVYDAHRWGTPSPAIS